jgi:hypothetical protein
VDNSIGIDYIDNAIDELVDLLGTKENIDPHPVHDLLRSKNIKECVKSIAVYLGLPIEIYLSYVYEANIEGKSGKGSTIFLGDDNNKFESTQIIRTDKKDSGSEGIVAQVLIPKNIPIYGSSQLNGYPIKVRVSNNCVDYPETFVAIMAHELSHILLASIASKKADNEYYTDLVPLILGFSDFVWDGRKTIKVTSQSNYLSTTTTTHTGEYGYLNDKQFNFAYSKINKILAVNTAKKKRLLELINRFERRHLQYEKYLSLFNDELGYFHLNKNINIHKNESERFFSLLDPSLFDEIKLLNEKNKDRLQKLRLYHSNLKHYTKGNLDILNTNIEHTKVFIEDQESKIHKIKKDIIFLNKYNKLLKKIKINAKYIGILVDDKFVVDDN